MHTYRNIGLTSILLCLTLLLASCKKENKIDTIEIDPLTTTTASLCVDLGNDTPNYIEGVESYFVVLAPKGKQVTAHYIKPVASFLPGLTSITEQPILESPTGTSWILFKEHMLLRLMYNQGNASASGSFYLDKDGNIQISPHAYEIPRFNSYGIAGNTIIVSAAAEDGSKEGFTYQDKDGKEGKARPFGIGISYVDTKTQQLKRNPAMIPAENFLPTTAPGEFVQFSGYLERDGKIWTAVIPSGLSTYGFKSNDGKYLLEAFNNPDYIAYNTNTLQNSLPGTQYPNSAYLAVFDNCSENKAPVIIKTDKMAPIVGRKRSSHLQMFWKADNGDIYAFSPSSPTHYSKHAIFHTQHKCGVMRVLNGQEEFDEGYGFVDLESMAGTKMLRAWHITEDYFLLQFFMNATLNARGIGANRLYIFKGSDKSLIRVQGLPDEELLGSTQDDRIGPFTDRPYYDAATKQCFIGVNQYEANPAIYSINLQTGVATKGLEVEAGSILQIGKLKAVKQ